jgi:peroxiredoxin
MFCEGMFLWCFCIVWMAFLGVVGATSDEGEGTSTVSVSTPLPSGPIAAAGISLENPAGESHSLTDFLGANATVLVFLHPSCPLSQRAVPPLNELCTTMVSQGVAVLGVFQPDVPIEDIQAFQKDYAAAFPFAIDRGESMTSALEATVTPEAFVLDSRLVPQYAGRVDDQYLVRGVRRPAAQREDLAEALDDLLSGNPVRVPRTTPVGCPIERQVAATQPPTESEKRVTFHKDIAPILNARCQMCHSPGNVAPFELMTYDDASDWMKPGLREIEARRMPPAQVEGDFAFVHENSLTKEEIETIRNWLHSGMEEGDPADSAHLPPPPSLNDWAADLGPPDIILEQSAVTTLQGSGPDLYRYVPFTLDYPEVLRVRAMQMLPTNRKIVHHALIGYCPSEDIRQLAPSLLSENYGIESGDSLPGYSTRHSFGIKPHPGKSMDGLPAVSGIMGYLPGQSATRLPEEADLIIPAHSDILVQFHYHRSGKMESDRTRLGIWLRKDDGKNRYIASSTFLSGDFTVVPKGVNNFVVKTSDPMPVDAWLYMMMPHCHQLGKTIDITARFPGAEKDVTLVRCPKWDFNWQATHQLATPVFLPKGTLLKSSVTYDNTDNNPRNPFRPAQHVFQGENSYDEMLLPILFFYSDQVVDPQSAYWYRYGTKFRRATFFRSLLEKKFDFSVKADGTLQRNPDSDDSKQ